MVMTGFQAFETAGIKTEVEISGAVNGWPICCTATEKVGVAMGAAAGHRRCAPAAINNANGTRNFSDAISQSV
jgi:hypothetical protein